MQCYDFNVFKNNFLLLGMLDEFGDFDTLFSVYITGSTYYT